MSSPRPKRRWSGPLALVIVLSTGAVTTREAVAAPRLVYLDFSDGTEALSQGDEDAAGANRSQLCASPRVGRWLGASDCGDRESCRRAIQARIEEIWLPFDVIFTSQRPGRGPYDLVLIAPPGGTCGFGSATGVAPVDCGDHDRDNVAFAFQCADTVESCARLVSHELAHTFGLAHSDLPCDIMSAESPSCPTSSFLDEYGRAHGTSCGQAVQNSYQALLAVLGPAPHATGGCAVGGGDARSAGLVLALAVCGCLARRRGRRRSD